MATEKANQATSLLLKLPVELVGELYRDCSTMKDVMSLSKTCRYLHDCFNSQAPSVINSVAPKCIVAFDEALTAVRAVNIIRDYQMEYLAQDQDFELHTCKLPPVVDPYVLTMSHEKPTLPELFAVNKLKHLVDCVREMVVHNTSTVLGTGSVFIPLQFADERSFLSPSRHPERWSKLGAEDWAANFYSSMYRTILSGAVFSRYYLEPFLSSNPIAIRLVEKFAVTPPVNEVALAAGAYGNTEGWVNAPVLDTDEINYLASFPLYDAFRDKEGEHLEPLKDSRTIGIFEPLAQYFIKKRGLPVPGSDLSNKGYFMLGNKAGKWIRMFQDAKDILVRTFLSGNKLAGLGRNPWREPYAEWRQKKSDSNQSIPELVSVSLVLYGVFQPEVARVPLHLDDARWCWLLGGPLSKKAKDNTRWFPMVDIPAILYALVNGNESPVMPAGDHEGDAIDEDADWPPSLFETNLDITIDRPLGDDFFVEYLYKKYDLGYSPTHPNSQYYDERVPYSGREDSIVRGQSFALSPY
ncbi:hypothetical protein ABW19_dt0207897 [Dactylella cylindrospora]|nr:hypothetical protein ABW19_dt0207897 [Dactylella cylindrospora]